MGANFSFENLQFFKRTGKRKKMSRLTSMGFEPEPSLSLDF